MSPRLQAPPQTLLIAVIQMSKSAPAWTNELGPFLRIGIPMGLTQVLQFSFNIVDVLMIGRLGPEHLAAAATGGSIHFAMILAGLGPALATAPLIAQALGANPDERDDIRLTIRMGLWAVLLFSPIALIVFLYADVIGTMLGQPAYIAEMARPFSVALWPVLPTALALYMLRTFLAALGKTQVALWIIALGTVLNGLLNYALIYGNWGAPRLELVGAGIASSVSEAFMVAALIAYIRWDPQARSFHLFRDFLDPHWARMREIIQLGWPIGIDIANWNVLNIAATFLMGRIGVEEMAAFTVARSSVAALAVMMSLGISSAGGVRVGLAAGAQDWVRVRQAIAITISISLLMALAIAIPCALYPEAIGALYLDPTNAADEAVIALIAVFLPIGSIFIMLDVFQFTWAIALRALKDVRMSMILSGISYWAIGFPLALALGFLTSLGSVGIWLGLLAGLSAASVLLGMRLRSRVTPHHARALHDRRRP